MHIRGALAALSISVLCTLAWSQEAKAPEEGTEVLEGREAEIIEAERVKRDELCGNACQLQLDVEHECCANQLMRDLREG